MTPAQLPALPKDFLRTCLLLFLREEPAHGYELLERTSQLGFDGSDPGGLYRSLRKLEQDGLVRSAWEPSDAGPQRRIYEITRQGGEELHRRAQGLVEGAEIIDRFLTRYEEFVALHRGRSSSRAGRGSGSRPASGAPPTGTSAAPHR